MEISEKISAQKLGTEHAPHLRAAMSTHKLMLCLIFSLIPALCVMVYFFGFGVIWQFAVTCITAVFCQMLSAKLRRRSVLKALKDPSGAVTALLLAMTLPPLLPWYFTVAATAFAMLLVRECFGGLGMNLFNPAMSGFVFLVVSVPAIFYSTWITPAPEAINVATAERTAAVIFKGASPDSIVDGIIELNRQYDGDKYADIMTGATFLENNKTSRKAGTVPSVEIDFTDRSFIAYSSLAAAYTLGGLFLIFMRVIRFQVPLAFLGTTVLAAFIWHKLSPETTMTLEEHMLLGGTMLGAFYIITDPVTTCGTFKGRILLSAITALLLIVIRMYGSYSDSVAFAVLLSNCLAPLMDVMTKRRPFGVGYKTGGMR